jgi:hypothetical protein
VALEGEETLFEFRRRDFHPDARGSDPSGDRQGARKLSEYETELLERPDTAHGRAAADRRSRPK